MAEEALAYIQNGLQCEQGGRLREAEEWLTRGTHALQTILCDLSPANPRVSVLKEHLRNAARHLQFIRSTLQQEGQQRQQRGEEKDESVVVPAVQSSPPPSPTRQEKSSSRLAQRRQPSHSSAARSSSRTSGFVLEAIDVATSFSRQKKYKQSVDMLQYAYDVGMREGNRPGNFHRIEEHLLLLRREYYNHCKPRFLQDNPVLPAEMDVLRKSGVTRTILLPIWDDVREGYARENVFMPCEGHWEDPFTPRLSSVQQEEGAQYMRISVIKPRTELCVIRTADPLNVKQTVVADCSMVCSLIICASYQQRFPKAKIINHVIYPQDNNGDPIVNPKGKYCVKMLLNGITRRITIDDRFPANPKTGMLLCTYSKDETELWVSILEKAFVKICGGSYDFPGSSSSSDLYKLSGWLPDNVSLKSEEFNPELQWMRLYKRHRDGSVLITASTSTLSQEEERGLLLAPSHAYAVLDIREVHNIRLLQLKNPWGRRSWCGMYSFSDKRKEARDLLAELNYTEALAEQGVFWITWDDLCRYFSRCSLSWNPYMLFKTPDGMSRRPTRISCHARFPYTTSTGQTPQFHIGVVNTPRPSRMHLVFARHITDVEEFGMQFEKDNPKVPYVGLKVYDVTRYPSIAQYLGASCTLDDCYCRRLAHGTELDKSLQPLHDVVYKSVSEHTLSFNCPAGTSNLLVVVNRTESTIKEKISFSLTLHTEWLQMKLNDTSQMSTGVYMHYVPQCNLNHRSILKGKWEKGVSCGGRSGLQTFVYNPQYLLTLTKPSMLSVRLCVPECTSSVQVHVVQKTKNRDYEPVSWSARVSALNAECSLVLHAPMYAPGGVVVDTSLRSCLSYDKERLLGERLGDSTATAAFDPLPPLPAGEYTILPSQWEKGVPEAFELTVETTEPHKLSDVPPEGVGFSETTLRGELVGGVATNFVSLVPKTDAYFSGNPKACLVATSSCVLTGRLLLLLAEDGNNDVSTNLTLFRAKDAATMERVASSGPYELYGVTLPPVRVDAGVTYVLLVSSHKPSRAKYVLRLYSSCPLKAWMQ